MHAIFERLSEKEIKKLIEVQLAGFLAYFSNYYLVQFVKLNKVLVPVISVKPSYNRTCLKRNLLYIRSVKGIEAIADSVQINSYISNRARKSLSEILKKL